MSSPRPTLSELRVVAQPESTIRRASGEHWTGGLYMRHLSIRATRLLIPTRVSANALTWLMLLTGIGAALVLTVPHLWAAVVTLVLIQFQALLDCMDGELARWRRRTGPIGIYVDRLSPDAGGGFTFADAMIAGLDRYGIGHECVLFYGGRQRLPDGRTSLPTVHFRAGAAARWQKIRYGVSRALGRDRGHHLNRSLAAAGIDFLWMLTPARFPKLGVPYAFTVWDLAHREHPYFPEVSTTGWTWDKREATYAEMLPRASYVVIGNEVGKELVRFLYRIPEERILPIAMPVPKTDVSPSRALASTLPRPYLLYPAQFWPHKNHVNAVLALRRAREQYGLDIDLVFTGSDQGNLAHVHRTVEAEGLTANVHFLGFVEDAELAGLYAGALGLLYLSFFGPDNLPPLEAFAAGCPVIASATPGHVAQLGNAALFADPTAPDAIADRIVRLHSDRVLRQTLVDNGRAIARERTVERYLAEVRAALARFEPVRRCWPLASQGGDRP